MIGIYKIENLITHEVYIGQSVNIAQRWKEHRYYAASQEYPLYRAIRKYGLDNFEFSVIQECSKAELNELEVYWIEQYDSFNNGYNLTKGGETGHPIKLTEEQVLEIYEKLKGTETMEDIAKQYGVTHPVISNINNGIIWVHDNTLYPIRKRAETEKRYCCDCGVEISRNAIRCVKCNGILRKMDKPITREQLKDLIRTTSFVQISKMFNVSDNAIRKWCDAYGLPRKKTDIKSFSDEEWAKI